MQDERELIPKWRQQIQNDSIAVTFQPIHRICLEKNWVKASQQVRSLQIFVYGDLGKNDGENIQTWSNLYNI